MLTGAGPYLICIGIGLINAYVGFRVLLANILPIPHTGPLAFPLLDTHGRPNSDGDPEEETQI